METKESASPETPVAEELSSGKVQMELPLRPLREVIKEITDIYDREGWLGVQGFSITLRTAHSSSNMRWGDLKLHRRKVVKSHRSESGT